MGNRFVARACEVLQAHRGLTDLPEFWRLIGCRHIETVTDREELIGAPTLQEILGIAKRVFAFRVTFKEFVDNHPEMDSEFAERYLRSQRTPNKTLRTFVLQTRRVSYRGGKRVSVPVYPAHLYQLHPTKGWRKSILDTAYDIKTELEGRGGGAKVSLYAEWPGTYSRQRLFPVGVAA